MSSENEKVPATVTFKGLEDDQAVFGIRHPEHHEDEVEIILNSTEYQEVLKLSENASTSLVAAFSKVYSVNIRQCLSSDEEDADWSPQREFDGSTDTNTVTDTWGRTEWSPDADE